MNFLKTVEELIKGFNLESELDKRKAYNKCIDYADDNLINTEDYNPFLAKAADILGQMRMYRDYMKGSIKLSGKEKLQLTYSDNSGPELVGNTDGLLYLSRIIRNLSKSQLSGEHIHLYYDEQPMYGKSFPLTIYFEDDEWFEKYALQDEINEEESTTEESEVRNIEAEFITAFMSTNDIPPPLLMTKGKLYKVISFEKYNDEEVWKKEFRNDNSRVFIFKFFRDDGEVEEIALDLDDESIIFFTKDQLEQVILD